MKKGVRIAAIASGPINMGRSAILVCMILREGMIEGVLSGRVAVDGADASHKIVSMLKKSRFRDQIRVIALNGIAIAGLNVVDVKKVCNRLGTGFVVLTRKRPRKELLIKALVGLSEQKGTDVKGRIRIVEEASKAKMQRVSGFFVHGDLTIDKRIADYAFQGLRIAHLVARGVATGESKGSI